MTTLSELCIYYEHRGRMSDCAYCNIEKLMICPMRTSPIYDKELGDNL